MADSATVDEVAVGSPIRVGVLGPFEASVGGAPVQLQQGRLRVLLAVLALSAGRAVSVERLADAAWGDELPANARRTVQTYITRLRSALGSEAITTAPSGYALRTSQDDVDALRFVRLVDRAAREADAERELLAEALQLWRGKAFDGLESDWLRDHEGVQLEERRLTATERRLDLDFEDGRVAAAVSELRELCSAYPLRESLWRRLLIALARTGRPAEALEQYEAVRVRIADELGVDPGVELQRLHARLLAGTLGDAVAPEPADQSMVPRQLPADIARFAGRAELLARLDELLESWADQGSVAVVAVHGAAGMGKTTLVVHWAHRVVGRFPDGQLHLNLRGYGPGEPMTPAAALDALLVGLGVPADQIPADVDARGSRLRSELADRRLLVILDNARNVDQVRPLLPGAGSSVVVVTSRSQLRGLVAREGAQRIGVDQLEPAESRALLADTLGDAVGTTDDAALSELAERCGHLPLALAIAAERAGRQPESGLAELVGELREEHDRLDALTGDESTDLRAVFTWSYQDLDAETAAAFRLLSLHPGPEFGLPAAAALTGVKPSVLRRRLDRLVEGNLLQQRKPGRFELHDLVRSYAAELTAQHDADGDRHAALGRCLDWYLHTMAKARRILDSELTISVDLGEPLPEVSPIQFTDAQQALAWLNGESQTLVSAVRGAAEHGHDRTTVGLTYLLWGPLMRRRAIDEVFALQRLAAEAARRLGDPGAEALATSVLGWTHFELTAYDEAYTYLAAALDQYEAAGDTPSVRRTLSNLGLVLQMLGRLPEAAARLERALVIARELEDARSEAFSLNNLSLVYRDLGRLDDAVAAVQRALRIYEESGNTEASGIALDTLGEIRLSQGRPSEALDVLDQSIAIFQRREDTWSEGKVLVHRGQAARDLGDADAARASWERALEIFDELAVADGPYFSRQEIAELIADLPPAGSSGSAG